MTRRRKGVSESRRDGVVTWILALDTSSPGKGKTSSASCRAARLFLPSANVSHRHRVCLSAPGCRCFVARVAAVEPIAVPKLRDLEARLGHSLTSPDQPTLVFPPLSNRLRTKPRSRRVCPSSPQGLVLVLHTRTLSPSLSPSRSFSSSFTPAGHHPANCILAASPSRPSLSFSSDFFHRPASAWTLDPVNSVNPLTGQKQMHTESRNTVFLSGHGHAACTPACVHA